MSHVLPADRAVVEEYRHQLEAGAPVAGCDYHLMTEDGRVLTVRDQARPVFDAKGPRRVRGVTIDVTERRRAREQFEAAMKMQADFVNFASHQLRTPLTGIKWMLELAMGEEDGSPDMRGFVADSRDASERLIVLVNDLLSVSRLEGGRMIGTPARCNLAQLMQDVLADIQPVVRKSDHQLEAAGLDAEHAVMGDAQMLRQVLQNLVSNAVKYTPHGGRIHVEITNDGAEVRCAVTDTGIGVPEEARDAPVREVLPRRERLQGRDRRHRPGPLHRPPDRRAGARAHLVRAGRRRRQPLPDRAPARDDRPKPRRPARSKSEPRKVVHVDSTHPARRRRSLPPQGRRDHAQAGRLHRDRRRRRRRGAAPRPRESARPACCST